MKKEKDSSEKGKERTSHKTENDFAGKNENKNE